MQVRYSIAVFVLLFLSDVAAKADFVVASNLPTNWLDIGVWEEVGLIAPAYNDYNNVSNGQTFIPRLSGDLTEVDALIGAGLTQPLDGSPPLQISIHTSNSGIPLSRLGTVELPASAFSSITNSDNTRETIDFRLFHIQLSAGSQYMVTFETPFGLPGTHGGHSPFFIGRAISSLGITASVARDGVNWEVYPGVRELAIEVRAIPEPSILHVALIAACLSGAMFTRRLR